MNRTLRSLLLPGALLAAGCSLEGAPGHMPPQPPMQEPPMQEPPSSGGHHCEDHEDELDPDVRAAAAREVTWAGPAAKSPQTVRLLGLNDFHGQLTETKKVANRPVGGAAVLASYLRSAAAGYDGRYLIVHAGDQVSASPPESALLQDEPSIEFLNTLANSDCQLHDNDACNDDDEKSENDARCNIVGTLGNHEFDRGKDELLRLLRGGNYKTGPFLSNPYPGARFPYVNANVTVDKTGRHLLPPYVIRRLGKVRVGVIGAVLKDTPTIVTASGVAGLTFGDEAQAINQQVAKLKARGVHSIIVTIHQGGTQTNYVGDTDTTKPTVSGAIAAIVAQLDADVDVVISGHTHQFSNALVSNAGGKPVLVVQAFSAGTAYDLIDLVVDTTTGDVTQKSARIITTFSDVAPGNQRDAAAQAIVDAAVAKVAPLVNRTIATIAQDLTRTASAAGEEPLGDLIADAQRAAMSTDFAFMNPGGIRADLYYARTPSNPADADGRVLWGELFSVQPFNNYVDKMTLTGAQVVQLLNQQWSLSGTTEAEKILQISGLTYSYDKTQPIGGRIVSVKKGGVAIDPAAGYTVAVNSFLADGGDGFTVLKQGTGRVVGPIDLDAFVTYMQGLPQPVGLPAGMRIAKQ